MKRLSYLTFLLSVTICTTPFVQAETTAQTINAPTLWDEYFDLLNQYPATLGPIGKASDGEIEIIRDVEKIQELEKTMGRKIGIVAKDRYWIWINDAVKFPSGKYGVYGRVLWVQSLKGTAGVAVMPVLPDARVVLNRNYRHATRSWEYELPRGNINTGESINAAAEREVKEETGMLINEIHLLGNMAPDTGFTNTVVPVFMAKVIGKEAAAPEESEAIAGIEAFSLEELKKGFIDGYLTFKVDGKSTQISLRDPFLAYALFQSDIQNLLSVSSKETKISKH